jgi:hypothetical protein
VLLYFFRQLEAVAITAVVCYAISLLIIHYALIKEWPIHIDLAFLRGAVLATMLMSIVLLAGLYAFRSGGSALLQVSLLVPAGIVTYAFVLVVLGVLGREHLQRLAKAFLR